MTEKTLTTENIKPALDALRGELAPWPVVAKKQDRLNTAQLNAANSGITSSLVAQIIANTAAIRALESAITGTGLRPLVVASLPAIGTQGILYIVPVTTYDPATDADVVNYSNEYIWIVAPDAPVTEGYYEQVGQTGIVINNGQLTITVNGTSVGTFTANQSGDTTAAITVPTNADYVDLSTSQTVTGGKTWTGEQSFTLPIVGSITGTASKAIADEDGTSIKTGYVNVAGNQTVTGQKDWSNLQTFSYGQIRIKSLSQEIGITPSASVIQYLEFADKNNAQHGKVGLWDYDNGASEIQLSISDKYKNGAKDSTGTSDIAFLSFGFQYNGTKFITFSGQVNNSIIPLATNSYALGSSSYQWRSIHVQNYYYNGTAWGLDQNNTWTGDNTFSGILKQVNSTVTKGTIPQSDTTAFNVYWGGTGVSSLNNALFAQRGYINADGSTVYTLYALENATGGTQTQLSLKYDPNDTVNKRYANLRGDFRPYSNGDYNLGTSTNKWKTLNGINPGALSFPARDYVLSMDVDTTDWDLTGTTFYYTPNIDGWLQISVSPNNNYAYIAVEYATLRDNCENTTGRNAMLTIPVVANKLYDITIIGSTIVRARLASAQGNV